MPHELTKLSRRWTLVHVHTSFGLARHAGRQAIDVARLLYATHRRCDHNRHPQVRRCDCHLELPFRAGAAQERGEMERDGTFHLPADFDARVRQWEGCGGRQSARVTVLDPHSLERQATYRGPTWLDRVGAGLEDTSQFRLAYFGEETQALVEARDDPQGAWPCARRRRRRARLRDDWQGRLRKLERDDVLRRLERHCDRVPHFARDGDTVGGVYAKRVRTAERSFAVIFQERDAALVPWRAEMDRALNQMISGRVNGPSFDFKVGRDVERALKVRTPWLER